MTITSTPLQKTSYLFVSRNHFSATSPISHIYVTTVHHTGHKYLYVPTYITIIMIKTNTHWNSTNYTVNYNLKWPSENIRFVCTYPYTHTNDAQMHRAKYIVWVKIKLFKLSVLLSRLHGMQQRTNRDASNLPSSNNPVAKKNLVFREP